MSCRKEKFTERLNPLFTNDALSQLTDRMKKPRRDDKMITMEAFA